MQTIPDGMELLKIGEEQEELTQHYNNVKLDLCTYFKYLSTFDILKKIAMSAIASVK